MGGDNRWQGYSHEELYQALNAGPGARAAGSAVDSWSGLADALQDIQQDINSGVTAAGASWEGLAADQARTALGPLGDWAEQAAAAADLMRSSTEIQGSLLGQARTDMPAPVPVTAEQPSGLTTVLQHLMGQQSDYEIQESASNAAALRAYQVMAGYESATTDNTSTLGNFGTPPQVVVDAVALPTHSPLAGLGLPGLAPILPTPSAPSPLERQSPLEREPDHEPDGFAEFEGAEDGGIPGLGEETPVRGVSRR